MSKKIDRKKSKLSKYTKLPIKILTGVRDFYVQSLNGCAGHVTFGDAVGYPAAHGFANLPRSFSANSSYSNSCSRDEDLRELIRISSARSLTGKVEAEILRSRNSSQLGGGGVAAAAAATRRSRTVTIGRIDEEKPCEFEVYPRSKSYAAS